MNTPVRLGIFGLGLAAVFGAALGAGHLTGPVGAEEKPHTAHGGMEHESHGGHESALPGGLLVSGRGYTLTTVPDATGAGAVRTAEFTAEAKEGR